jgi:1-acyl-sn-glycerol-3-phosphate acyltransferase
MVAGKLTGAMRKAQFPFRAPTVPGGVEPPAPKVRLGADYDTEWARSRPARMARAAMVEGVMRPMVQALGNPKVRNLDRIEGLDGPVVFAANHHSHVDTPTLLTSIPERFRRKLVVGAAADYFFGTRFQSAFSALVIGAIPIERTKVGRKSADLARELIDDGHSLLIFPEGGRSPDGWGQPFRGGAAYIAMRAGVPVVPIHLDGTGGIIRKGSSKIRRADVIVTFGSPQWPAEGEDARKFAARLEAEVAALADEAATDWWQARRRAYAKTSPTLTGPDAVDWRRSWALGAKGGAVTKRRRRWPEL